KSAAPLRTFTRGQIVPHYTTTPQPRRRRSAGDALDFVCRERRICRHDRQLLELRLRDQHAVEWIAMVWRQRSRPETVLMRYRQRCDIAAQHQLRDHQLRRPAEL